MSKMALLSKQLTVPDPKPQKIDIFVAGYGAVGSTLIRQINDLSDSDYFHIVGICNSSRVAWFDEKSESVINNKTLSNGESKKWDKVINKLSPKSGRELIFVDATGEEEVANLYLKLFEKGIHVVTPSKIANTRKQIYFDLLHKTAEENSVSFLYETNVGAGLPVLRTVRDLVKSGDEITEISGVLSGTMTYIFTQLEAGRSFSESVLEARQLGYAEPDPRDDLSGEDVARKMMILSRVSGYSVERDELQVEPITPKDLENVDSQTFLERLPEFDQLWKEKFSSLRKKEKTLRYLGTMNKEGISVGLKELEIDSPIARLKGTNNIIQISTKRYSYQPLIIQGPGAGKEVTSAGILADIRIIMRDSR